MLRIEAFAAYPSGASLFPPMCSMDLQRLNRCSGACRGPYGAGPYNSRGRGPPTIICLCRGPYPPYISKVAKGRLTRNLNGGDAAKVTGKGGPPFRLLVGARVHAQSLSFYQENRSGSHLSYMIGTMGIHIHAADGKPCLLLRIGKKERRHKDG